MPVESAPASRPAAVQPEHRPLLRVRGLRTRFPSPEGDRWAVDGVDFDIHRGETLALVGESGSGKSVTALSIVRLVPEPGQVAAGQVEFDGVDLLRLPARRLRQIRGRRIGYVFQDPMTSLNPTLTVGFQIRESLRLHQELSRRQATAAAVDLLARVGIPRPAERLADHPHQFSGGMRQRLMIAMALACGPDLVIADEPTTALDVTVQAQILDLLATLTRESGTAVLLITHDLAAAAGLCDRVAVMYGGQIVETGPARQLYTAARMPYSRGLLDCLPRLDDAPDREFTPIEGSPPDLARLPPGCRFAPRCPIARPVCDRSVPELLAVDGPGHLARCRATETEGWAA